MYTLAYTNIYAISEHTESDIYLRGMYIFSKIACLWKVTNSIWNYISFLGAKVNIKRSEDCRDKFFRTKRRLNLYHAEYLIALQEAGDYDRDFRTILLPGLLQIEQTWCEKQMGKWSEVLDQILKNSSSLTTSVHLKLKEFEFSKEYMELISKHK